MRSTLELWPLALLHIIAVVVIGRAFVSVASTPTPGDDTVSVGTVKRIYRYIVYAHIASSILGIVIFTLASLTS